MQRRGMRAVQPSSGVIRRQHHDARAKAGACQNRAGRQGEISHGETQCRRRRRILSRDVAIVVLR